MARILIVDDEPAYRQVLKAIFEDEGYEVRTASDGRSALDELNSSPVDVVLSDVRMPDMDGIALLAAVRDEAPEVGVVLMTAYGTVDIAREAFKLGADDFIQKPFNNDELRLIVKRTIEKQQLISENRAFRFAQQKKGGMSNIIGSSKAMRSIFETIAQIADEESTILVTGESGTGKELVARAIHDLSRRSDKPFVPINCGAMPENLLEAELFGYVRGAFTGAAQNRKGLFEAANHGTIFLDEIGEMSPLMQVKLLRVLQDGMVRPVGASTEIPLHARVIAATNRDLKKMVEDNEMRSDFFYRISVIPISVPPLRDRREDIPELVDHFVRKFCKRSGKRVTIGKDAVEKLRGRSWEGNVRELEHAVERAVALTADGDEIAVVNCSSSPGETHRNPIALPEEGVDLHELINSIERSLVCDALSRTGGNQTRAAELLGLPVHAVRHLLAKHDL